MKLSVKHIPGIQNNNADTLSQGSVPTWLKLKGRRLDVEIKRLSKLIRNALPFWESCGWKK